MNLCLLPLTLLAAPAELPYVVVSPRDPRYLELSDGTPYVPVGLNLITAPWRQDGDPARRLADLDDWLAQLQANGGNFIRVWLSHDFWDIEHERSGVFDEAKARRIDELLALARRRGIRLKLCLEHFREVRDDLDYRQTWSLKPLHWTKNGGPAADMADWFDGEASRAAFKRKLAWYQQRYGSDPIVFGWELWNEVNACRGTGDKLAWSEVMLAELRRLFPRNLSLQSLGSFDNDSQTETYRRHSNLPGNDLAQVHRYLDLGAKLEVCHGPVDVLAADAVRRVRGYVADRPVLLAESGAVEPNHSGPFKLYDRDSQGTILHDVLFAPFFAGAAGPGHCWHWDRYVAPHRLWWQFGRFSAAIAGLDPPAEGFQPQLLEHPRLRVYLLRGRRHLLAWCRDKESWWRTELAEQRPPEPLQGARIDLAEPLTGRTPTGARTYDPWRDEWAPLTWDGATAVLPEFARSLVLRIPLAP